MKTVILKAEVPDDEIDNLMLTDSSGTLPFSIIQRPTDEEMLPLIVKAEEGTETIEDSYMAIAKMINNQIFGENAE